MNMITIPSAQEMFNKAVENSGLNFSVKKSISGYYRLFLNDEIILDDSACEDVQDEESALYFFAEYINEYYH